MAETFKTSVLIIGSGPAGCTAAIYAARASLNPIMVHGFSLAANSRSRLTLKTTLDLRIQSWVHG